MNCKVLVFSLALLLLLPFGLASSNILSVYAQSSPEVNLIWSYTAGGRVSSVAVSGDGKYVVLGSEDSYLYLLDAKDGRIVWKQNLTQAVLSVDVSFDASRIIAFAGPV